MDLVVHSRQLLGSSVTPKLPLKLSLPVLFPIFGSIARNVIDENLMGMLMMHTNWNKRTITDQENG
jgi:hypothetical protein